MRLLNKFLFLQLIDLDQNLIRSSRHYATQWQKNVHRKPGSCDIRERHGKARATGIMNKKENARNEQSRPLADENKTLRDYVVYLQNAREKEQEILASEIHDKIAQNLLALRLDIAMLHARTQQTHPLINSKASILLREIDVALQNTKNLINQLHAPVFALGLMASLDWKLKEFKKFWGMNCALKMNSDERSLERFNNYTIPLVRILHDALSSALNQRGRHISDHLVVCNNNAFIHSNHRQWRSWSR